MGMYLIKLIGMSSSHFRLFLFLQDKYVCIEPGYVKNWKTLAPGEEWIGQQVLKIAGGP
jgi:hypothetical protein